MQALDLRAVHAERKHFTYIFQKLGTITRDFHDYMIHVKDGMQPEYSDKNCNVSSPSHCCFYKLFIILPQEGPWRPLVTFQI